MRLVHIEANRPDLFGPISFRDGLNVVFAKVRDPSAHQQSSHNLGKSFLMDVIDFSLGGGMDKEHPFKKRRDLFGDFQFTLQVCANSGLYISARRPVQGRAACSILVTSEPVEIGRYPDQELWTHRDLSVEDFKSTLDGYFALADLKPYNFRKGLGYQLRGQSDYQDEFQIAKFSGGKDREWRPFVARILGFSPEIFLSAYDKEDRIATVKKTIKEIEGSDSKNRQQFDEVRGLIEIREAEITERREELSRFHFAGVEREVNKNLVTEIEASLSVLNTRRYAIDHDLGDIERSLTATFDFDFELVRRVYREAGVEFPTGFVREFEELVDFNRRISVDRNARFLELRKDLIAERAKVETQIDQLDRRRQESLKTLREAESFTKYRRLTDRVFELEAGLRGLRERLVQLNQVAVLRIEQVSTQKELLDANAQVAVEVQSANEYFSEIRRLFNAAVHQILGARAVLSAGLNKAGHIEFKTAILDDVARERETFQGDGTSYKKLLCACVDLAILQAHARSAYYRFVYHDGVFEGLDNRRKVALVNYVRGVVQDAGVQYVLTVIDSDLPRDEHDNKLLFQPEEVVLSLHDGGADGRLFRMDRF